MHKEREDGARIIGIFLIVLGLINIFFHLTTRSSIFLLWYCSHITILAGIVILLKKRYWLNALINVGFFPIFFWIIDYLVWILFDYNLFYIINYVFEETNRALFLLYHQHFFVVPLMILALWFMGGAVKGAWKGSIVYGAVLVLISRFADASYNLNCAHKQCIAFFPDTIFFLILQFVVIILSFVLANWLLVKFLKK